MKKIMLMAVAILFSAATVFATDLRHGKMTIDTTKKAKPAKVQYTCTMHPEVISDKPGKCPKCGMTLVKKEAEKKPSEKTKM
ncbi:heavy metal-binding domain-containing protein [Mucilaginibacter sp. BT774]|uniref:heavy metal-binding domain-containing protein n=1 Tax=Mucilaginibacter sp. BT774 TaxID=3062276 RepID=UPI002675A7A5|nr:heavy metal-binding domain-containing protein [Mucilaginibacter sp. BT774]MDO3628026.1 heavy metal-binding domain-containing protein [Mucilaginibacter sp. BT774]